MLIKPNLKIVSIVLLVVFTTSNQSAQDVQIDAYKPKGVYVSIPRYNTFQSAKFYGKQSVEFDNLEGADFVVQDFNEIDGRLVASDENIMLTNGTLWFHVEIIGNGVQNYVLKDFRNIVLEPLPVTISAYKPRGIRVTLPNDEGVEGFVFWANVNTPLRNVKQANIRLTALEPINGKWIAEDDNIGLLVNDIIYYVLNIRRHGKLEKYSNRPVLYIKELLTPSLRATSSFHTFNATTATAVRQLTAEPEMKLLSPVNDFSPYAYNAETETLATHNVSTAVDDETIQTTATSRNKRLQKQLDLIERTTEYQSTISYPFSTTTSPNFDTTPKICAYSPKGMRVILPFDPKIEDFYFWANINDEIDNRNNAVIKLSTFEPVNEEWSVQDDNVQLNKGDTVYYILYVRRAGRLYIQSPKQFIVEELTIDETEPSEEVTLSVQPATTPTSVPKLTSVSVQMCRESVTVQTSDVLLDFETDSIQKVPNPSLLTHVEIDGCEVTYKAKERGDIPERLTIKIK